QLSGRGPSRRARHLPWAEGERRPRGPHHRALGRGRVRVSVTPARFFVRRRLIAGAVALPVVETAILWAVGMETALGIAPQVSAPGPFDVFHDLRWLLVHHGAIERGWWRHMPPLRTVGWIGLCFVVLSIDGALLSVSPPLFRLPIAAVAGLFNAWAWFGIVHAVAGRPAPRFIPAPAGLVAVIVIVVGGAAIGFETVTSRARLSHAAHAVVTKKPASGKPVLIVSGFGTHWNGEETRRLPGAFDERRFSYKGVGGDAQPLPYGEND